MKKNNWGGVRKGAGRQPVKESERKQGVKVYLTEADKKDVIMYGHGDSFSEKALELIIAEINRRKI